MYFKVPRLLYGAVWLRGCRVFFEDQNGCRNYDVRTLRSHSPNLVVPQVNYLGRNCGELWRRQDEATSHTAIASMEVLSQMFPNGVIPRNGGIPWAEKSLDLSACDFFLWGYINGKVHTCIPNNVTVLKQRIEEKIQNIPDNTLRKSMADVSDRVEECLRKAGSHLTNTVFKN
jgi:hypothetical protein